MEVCVDNEIEDKNGSKHEQGIENACLCRNAGIKSAGTFHIDTKRYNTGAIIGTGTALGAITFERFENRNPNGFLIHIPTFFIPSLDSMWIERLWYDYCERMHAALSYWNGCEDD